MAWKNVQYENGKMRTSEGGGSGSSTFADLEDVSFSNLQDGQVPKYNSSTQKWENANESGGGGTVTDVEVDGVSVVNQQGVAEIPAIPDGLHHYSTTEQVIGTWIDGKPIYEKTINVGHNYGSPSGVIRPLDYTVSELNIDNIINYSGIDLNGQTLPYVTQNTQYSIYVFVQNTVSHIQIRKGTSMPYDKDIIITLQYTKTTD